MARATAALALLLPGLQAVVVATATATVGRAAVMVLLLQVHQAELLHGINKRRHRLQVANPATAATAGTPVRAMAMPMPRILRSRVWVLLLVSVVLLVALVRRRVWVLCFRTTTPLGARRLPLLLATLLHLL